MIAKVVWFAFNETKMNQFLAVWVAKMMAARLTFAFTLMAGVNPIHHLPLNLIHHRPLHRRPSEEAVH
jgi:hypothetical protein